LAPTVARWGVWSRTDVRSPDETPKPDSSRPLDTSRGTVPWSRGGAFGRFAAGFGDRWPRGSGGGAVRERWGSGPGAVLSGPERPPPSGAPPPHHHGPPIAVSVRTSRPALDLVAALGPLAGAPEQAPRRSAFAARPSASRRSALVGVAPVVAVRGSARVLGVEASRLRRGARRPGRVGRRGGVLGVEALGRVLGVEAGSARPTPLDMVAKPAPHG